MRRCASNIAQNVGSNTRFSKSEYVDRTKIYHSGLLAFPVQYLVRVMAAFTHFIPADMITDTEKIILSLSGLDQSELCWTKRLLRALGITLAQTFSRRSTHLLCPSACGAKYDKAREWNIPVVGMAWLEDMATEGKVPDINEYLIGDAGDRVAKGKAKNVQMIDTTNNANSKPYIVQHLKSF